MTLQDLINKIDYLKHHLKKIESGVKLMDAAPEKPNTNYQILTVRLYHNGSQIDLPMNKYKADVRNVLLSMRIDATAELARLTKLHDNLTETLRLEAQ